MNLDAAWRLASGYALVGQVDMGLYVQGAAFRQFSGSTYIGGNFIPVASKDVGLTGLSAQPGFDSTDVDEKKAMYISDTACTPTLAYDRPQFSAMVRTQLAYSRLMVGRGSTCRGHVSSAGFPHSK